MRLCYPIPSADPTSSEAYRQLQRQLAHKEEALAALVEAVSSLPPEVIGMPEAVQHDHVEHPVDVMVPGSKWKIVHEPVAAVQHEIVQEPMVVTPDCVSPQYASPLEESAEAVATATPASSAAQASGALGSAPPSQCAALGAGLAAAGGTGTVSSASSSTSRAVSSSASTPPSQCAALGAGLTAAGGTTAVSSAGFAGGPAPRALSATRVVEEGVQTQERVFGPEEVAQALDSFAERAAMQTRVLCTREFEAALGEVCRSKQANMTCMVPRCLQWATRW